MAAERLHASPRNLNRTLHAAAGIVIVAVAVELTPRALEATSSWLIALAFALGGLAYVGIEATVARLQRKHGETSGQTGMWMVYIAVTDQPHDSAGSHRWSFPAARCSLLQLLIRFKYRIWVARANGYGRKRPSSARGLITEIGAAGTGLPQPQEPLLRWRYLRWRDKARPARSYRVGSKCARCGLVRGRRITSIFRSPQESGHPRGWT